MTGHHWLISYRLHSYGAETLGKLSNTNGIRIMHESSAIVMGYYKQNEMLD